MRHVHHIRLADITMIARHHLQHIDAIIDRCMTPRSYAPPHGLGALPLREREGVGCDLTTRVNPSFARNIYCRSDGRASERWLVGFAS